MSVPSSLLFFPLHSLGQIQDYGRKLLLEQSAIGVSYAKTLTYIQKSLLVAPDWYISSYVIVGPTNYMNSYKMVMANHQSPG